MYVDHLAAAIRSAQLRLWVKIPWIGPLNGEPARLLVEVASAARRGVDVRVLLRPEASNSAALQELSSTATPHRTIRYLHEKEMLVDDRLIVFSANFTPKELGRNDNHAYEITALGDIEAAEAAFHSQWILPESEASAGDEAWTRADQVVPDKLLALLGRTKLNPLQAKALPVVFGSETGIVVTAPTGSGKTTVGEAAVLKAMRLQGKKAVYITPSRALTRELHGTFERWQASGIRIAILSGDVDADMDAVARSDLWVSTTEKFESAFRRSSMADAIADVGCVVVDEIHFLGDPSRGPLLEAMLARLRLLAARTRLVGLSATVANDQQLADWLSAQLIQSSWRPVQLTVQVLGYEPGEKWLDDEKSKDRASNHVVEDVASSGGSVIVFCGSKPKAQRVAAELAGVPLTDDDEALAHAVLDKGVGLHYRGLSSLRDTERRFRQRELAKLVATSGLAQGVNLPARAVVIRDTTLGKEPLSTGDALQMAGRAGRVGLEDAGFAFLLAPTAEVSEWRSRLVEGHAVRSHLAESLADHVLAEVLLGRIRSAQTLREWFAGTFAAHQGGLSRAEADAVLNSAMGLLNDNGFVAVASDGDTLECTDLGALTSRFLIDAVSAAAILSLLPGPDPASADEAESRLLVAVAVAAAPFSSAFAPPSSVDQALALLPAGLTSALGPSPQPGTLKSLVAAHIALADPALLGRPGRIADMSTSELNDLADDFARHLAWLAALGSAHWLGWAPAVASDLSGRIRWRVAQPQRGSGRLLRLLERRIPGDQHRRRLPAEYKRASRRSASIDELAAAGDHGPALPLVHLDLAATVRESDIAVSPSIRDTAALPVRLVAAARSGVEHMSAAVEQWDGAAAAIPLPGSAARRGEVVVEAIAYGRIDWDWADQRVTFPKQSVDPLEAVRQAIASLPVAVLVLPKRSMIFGRGGWAKRAAEAAMNASSDLQPVAVAASGAGGQHRRSWRLAECLRQFVAVDADDGDLAPPATALRKGRCGPSSWALCYAALCRQAGLDAGVVQQRTDERLIAIVQVDGAWKLVPADAAAIPANPAPLVPASIEGQLGLLEALPPDPPPPRPEPAWEFLKYYRQPRSAHPAERGTSNDGQQSSQGATPVQRVAGTTTTPKGGGSSPPRGRAEKAATTAPVPQPFDGPSTVTPATRADLEARSPGLFEKHPRAYSRWSEAEDDHLRSLVAMGLGVAEMSRLHGRQTGAIRSRLDKLGLRPSK